MVLRGLCGLSALAAWWAREDSLPVLAKRLDPEGFDHQAQDFFYGDQAGRQMRLLEFVATYLRSISKVQMRSDYATASLRMPVVGEDLVPGGIPERVRIGDNANSVRADTRLIRGMGDLVILRE
jgi:hypothetical protein